MMSSCLTTSSSSTTPLIKHDVFISFRGKDTRNNFISHLRSALLDKRVETFIDYKLNRGDEISPALYKAIEESQVSVIIFSKGYASSKWCLEELVKILECKQMYGQIVIPVFYEIDPCHVRNQTASFAEAFADHEQRFKDKLEMVQTWKEALTKAANLCGFDSFATKPESTLIDAIIKEVLKGLNDKSSTDDNNLIGIESGIKEIELLLNSGSKDVCAVGIWGIGGIGKTTLAGAVYDKIYCQFDGSSFIRDVREEEQNGGLSCLQRELLSIIFGNENVRAGSSVIGGTFTKKRLGRKKLLIVFDDVTDYAQIEYLIGGFGCLSSGSRIIITTRDKQTLNNCKVDQIYEVKGLCDQASLQLFSQYAFRQNHPMINYIEQSNKVVQYTRGVPLALKVLGCFLYNKSEVAWESAMDKIDSIPHIKIQKVLKISYDGLDDDAKQIFLDIACFFKGEDVDLVKKVLDASGFFAEIGISTLIDKSLITISKKKKILVHDLLQAMGREIVRQESIENPGKRSRLWHPDDIYHVLTENTGTKRIEGISLDMSKIRDIYLKPHSFTKMHRLRFLKFYCSHYGEKNKLHAFEGLGSVFTRLKYLYWHGYPFKSLTSNFHLEDIVALYLPHSNIEQVWDDVQDCGKLIEIDLSNSEHLTKCPDLSLASDIKVVKLNGCSTLETLPQLPCNLQKLYISNLAIKELPSSIQKLTKLETLIVNNCRSLENLPDSLCCLIHLKCLNLSGCSKLCTIPEVIGALTSLEELRLDGTAIEQLPSSIKNLSKLTTLSLKRCNLQETGSLLFPDISGLHRLTVLDLTDCGITKIPDSFNHIFSVRRLYLGENNFEKLPVQIIYLPYLELLDISCCKRLQFLPKLQWICINVHSCTSLVALSGLSTLPILESRHALSFNFINCFNLNCNALEDIVKDARQSVLETSCEEYNKGCNDVPSACICFPGGEMPGWFSFQNAGSFIHPNLPSSWFNNNFVGFGLCAIVAFRDHQDDGRGLDVSYECRLESKEGHCFVVNGSLEGWANGYRGPRYVGSDHVFVGFCFPVSPHDNNGLCCSSVSMQFYLQDRYGDRIECCKVKSCGVHLMYTQDLGESSGSFNSDEEEY